MESNMLAKIPQITVDQAKLQSVSVGQLSLGPISVASLTVRNIDVSLAAAQAILQDVKVTLTVAFSVEWHVHVGLPDGIPDIDIGDTVNLGSFSFGLPVGQVIIPGLTNLKFHIPSLAAQGLSASADSLALGLNNVTAEHLAVADLVLPSNGFSLAGLSLASVAASGIGVPAASVGHATVTNLHGDPLTIPAIALNNLTLPAVQIPTINSSVPLDIPANLQGPSPGFDAGILRVVLHIVPSVLVHVDHLEINNTSATATAEAVVLHDVIVPYDAHNLTLSQIGINVVQIPAITIA
jgi:hypothetical protein